MSLSVAMVASVGAIGGRVVGYDTGVISGAILYIKRRPLLIGGLLGMVATLGVLRLGFRANSAGAGTSSLAIITALCLAVYIVSFAFSLGPIVWLMISDIYPLRNRAQAMAVSTASNWGANFLVSFSFPVMASRLGPTATFFTYAAFGVLTLVFIMTKVPETKGK